MTDTTAPPPSPTQVTERNPVQLCQTLTITKRIGKGRLGVMYAAVHDVLARRFAVKVLRPSYTANEEPRDRLRRAVRQITQVEHPNIIALADMGQVPDGRYYVTMDYVRGSQLTQLLGRDGRFTVKRSVPLLLQIVEALDAVWRQHMTHGDLKPNNVMCVEMGLGHELVRISDWMLAPALFGADGVESSHSKDLAFHMRMHGNVDYVSPEELNGASADWRSDQYALGAIAYHMLTGQPPFGGQPDEVAKAHCRRDPVPPSRRSGAEDVPEALDAVVLRCLEKDPGNRYQDVTQLLEHLRRFAPTVSAAAREVLEGPPEQSQQGQEIGGEEILPESAPKLRQLLFKTAIDLAEALNEDNKLATHSWAHAKTLKAEQSELTQLTAQAGLTENQFEDIRREMREQESVLRYEVIDLNLAKSEILERGGSSSEIDDVDERIAQLEAQLNTLEESRTAAFAELNQEVTRNAERMKVIEHDMAIQFRQLFTDLNAVRGVARTDAMRALYNRMSRCRAALNQLGG